MVEHEDVGNEPGDIQHPQTSVPIALKVGYDEERLVHVDIGRPVAVILEIIASERGCAVKELVLIREAEEEPVSSSVVIGSDYLHHHRHHVHHIGKVRVTVHYQAASHHHEFERYSTIERVLSWAIGTFGIDPAMATEFELARHGLKEELPLTEHVGHLAGRDDALELDLIRGHLANGSSAGDQRSR